MMKSYIIAKIDHDYKDLRNSSLWYSANKTSITNYRWSDNGYKPEVKVTLCYSENYLYLNFHVNETNPLVRFMEINSEVFKDSAVELFINLFPGYTEEYFNLEFNAAGTILMKFGDKNIRQILGKDDIEKLIIDANIEEDLWKLYCRVPISLFEKYYKRKFVGSIAKGNFYKCGDETKFEHYGAWSPVGGDKPDFHQPKYFGNLFFEEQ